jgi:hypothetical protein
MTSLKDYFNASVTNSSNEYRLYKNFCSLGGLYLVSETSNVRRTRWWLFKKFVSELMRSNAPHGRALNIAADHRLTALDTFRRLLQRFRTGRHKRVALFQERSANTSISSPGNVAMNFVPQYPLSMDRFRTKT